MGQETSTGSAIDKVQNIAALSLHYLVADVDELAAHLAVPATALQLPTLAI